MRSDAVQSKSLLLIMETCLPFTDDLVLIGLKPHIGALLNTTGDPEIRGKVPLFTQF